MPVSIDTRNKIASAISLSPAARTASANGTGVDLAGYRSATVVVVAGTITDGTHALKIQDSDDNSSFSDVASDYQGGSFSDLVAASDDSVQEVDYLGTKRYLRVVVTASGTTSGGVYGATVVRSQPRSV